MPIDAFASSVLGPTAFISGLETDGLETRAKTSEDNNGSRSVRASLQSDLALLGTDLPKTISRCPWEFVNRYSSGKSRSEDGCTAEVGQEQQGEADHVTSPQSHNKEGMTCSSSAQTTAASADAVVLVNDEIAEGVRESEEEAAAAMPIVDNSDAAMELQKAEMEFSWDLYLAEMNAYPVPADAFPHVKKSLWNGLEEGTYVEYIYPDDKSAKKAFWFLELLFCRGSDVYVRYLGLENQPEENFWLYLPEAEVFPCETCDRKLYACRPPKVVCKHRAYLGDLIEKSRTLPTPTIKELDWRGLPFKERIKKGTIVEVIGDEKQSRDSNHLPVWPATVAKNIGGRLFLRYWQPASSTEPAVDGKDDVPGIWMFCTDARLQKLGWAKENPQRASYYPPKVLEVPEDKMADILSTLESPNGPLAVLQSSSDGVPSFEFREFPSSQLLAQGNLVEFVHPKNHHQIVPAVVKEVAAGGGVLIEVLDVRKDQHEPVARWRHAQSLDILPINWCKKNGVRLTRPTGWTAERGEFTWQRIIDDGLGTTTNAKTFAHLNNLPASPLQRGQKLEVANRSQPDSLCVATVVKVIPPLVWVHIDSYGQSSTFILPFDSCEMYPVGFCGANMDCPDIGDHLLKLPRLMTHGRRMASIRGSRSQPSSPSKSSRAPDVPQEPLFSELLINPKPKAGPDTITVHINAKCYAGPYITNKKLVGLAKYIGPGPVQLVLQCTVNSLISCGNRPTKMMLAVQPSGENPRSSNWERVKVKAKAGGRRHEGWLDVVKSASQTPDFLRNLCISFEACPSLVTVEPTAGRCPEHCHQFTKPDLKHVPLRKTKTAKENDEPETAKGPKNLELRRLQSAVDSEEEGKEGSQTAEDDVETVASSRGPSRAVSPDTVISTALRKSGSSASLRRMKSSEPLNKKTKFEPSPLVTNVAGKMAALLKAPQERIVQRESAAAYERSTGSGKENDMMDDVESISSSNSDSPPAGLVDDSEYLIRFNKDPRKWSVAETSAFLRRHLPRYSETPELFRQEEIDGDALMMMVASDFQFLEVDAEDAELIVRLIERMTFSLYMTGQTVPMYASWK